MLRLLICLLSAYSVATLLLADAATQQKAPTLIPWPKTFKQQNGHMELKASAEIVAASKELKPLATVLSQDIERVTGIKLSVSGGPAVDGDIVLALDPSLKKDGRYFSHALTINTRAQVNGEDYAATSEGTVSLLQLIDNSTNGTVLPRVELTDYSPAPYPGMMLDVGRQKNSIEVLRDCVNLCRIYKVRYFHLHLNDMEGFTFESRLFPKLGTNMNGAHGGPAPVRYSREQLEDLLLYADERGVTIVPELETVFHTGSMMQDLPDVFFGPGVLDMTSEKMYGALEPLIEEMCSVFKSSPYFHIGCDEADYTGLAKQPTYKEYIEKNNIKDIHELYAFHINRLDKIIKKNGKRTIVWQDCPLPKGNKDIIEMVWHIEHDHGATPSRIYDGRPVIQVTWIPSINNSVKEGYDWRVYDNRVQPGLLGYGSQMVLWEAEGSVAIPFLRYKVPPRQERTRSPEAEKTYANFCQRLTSIDAKLDLMLTGIKAKESGLKSSIGQWLVNGGLDMKPTFAFAKELSLSLKSRISGGTIRYTIDNTEPTAASDEATSVIKIANPSNDKITVRARVYDSKGKAMGSAWTREYSWEPFTVTTKGCVSPDDPRFGKALALELGGISADGSVRYQINGAVTAASPEWKAPIIITNSCEIKARMFSSDGNPCGSEWKKIFQQIDFDPTSLTYGKPVTASGGITATKALCVTDGIINRDQYIDFTPGPQTVMVDLGKETLLGSITLFTYWDGGRSYEYIIETSSDTKTWKMVGDGTKNKTAATEKGYDHKFEALSARYIRVTMIKNTANMGLHVIEIRAFPPKAPRATKTLKDAAGSLKSKPEGHS